MTNIKQEITIILNETPIDERTDRILELLANQRKEITEEIEGIGEMAKKFPMKIAGSPDTINECKEFNEGYNKALLDILTKIKEL